MEPSWARRPPVQEPQASGYRACLLAQTPSPPPIRVMQQINLVVQLLWRKSEAQGHLALRVVLEAVRGEAGAFRGRRRRSFLIANYRYGSPPSNARLGRYIQRHHGAAAGWRLREALEGLIDDRWLEAKPKWKPLRGTPVNYGYVWAREL